MTDAQVFVTSYTVSCLPLDHPEQSLFAITVEWAAPTGWALRRQGRCADARGRWEHEPLPSGRGDRFLARFRFQELDEALAVAVRLAPTLTVNGHTVGAVAARGRWWE